MPKPRLMDKKPLVVKVSKPYQRQRLRRLLKKLLQTKERPQSRKKLPLKLCQ